jgi:hypothetical protein
MRFLMVLLCLSVTSAMAAEKPKKVVTIVKIDGASYKVRQRGEEATVSRQSAIVNADSRHFSRAKLAAELASGCTAIEAYPVLALLNVVLDCTKPSSPPETGIEIFRNE